MVLQIEKDLLKSLFVLGNVVEAKDPYTAGHLWRVSQYAKLTGIQMGLNQSEVSALMAGAFLHDLGKIGIPDSILNKKSKLDDDEYGIIKTHPKIGKDIIQSHPLAVLVRDVIEQHHEMPNGKGYPFGLDWDEVTLFSRIVGICDAFDAITSNRSYRKGLPLSKTLTILKEEQGKQFDTNVLNYFLQIPISNLEHTIGHSEEGIPLLACPKCDGSIQVNSDSSDGELGVCRSCQGSFRLHKDTSLQNGFSLEFQEMASPESTVYHKNIDESMIDSLIAYFPSTIELVG